MGAVGKVAYVLPLFAFLVWFFFTDDLTRTLTPLKRPPLPALDGAFKRNNLLSDFTILAPEIQAPETVIADKKGTLFVGAKDGYIYTIDPKTNQASRFVHTGGRPGGLCFNSNYTTLYVADFVIGVLSVDVASKELRILTTVVDDQPLRFADDIEIGPDGSIFFSDASAVASPRGIDGVYEDLLPSILDATSGKATGRLIKCNAQGQSCEVLLSGLLFGNGVSLSADGSFVLVADTLMRRVWKHWLKGSKAGQSEVVVETLPGYPDGISRAQDGTFRVAIFATASPLEGLLDPNVYIRSTILRLLPHWLLKAIAGKHEGLVVTLDSSGQVQQALYDDQHRLTAVTSVCAQKDALYLGTLLNNGLVKVSLK